MAEKPEARRIQYNPTTFVAHILAARRNIWEIPTTS
jgi:hypothetical protein